MSGGYPLTAMRRLIAVASAVELRLWGHRLQELCLGSVVAAYKLQSMGLNSCGTRA